MSSLLRRLIIIVIIIITQIYMALLNLSSAVPYNKNSTKTTVNYTSNKE